MPPVNSWYVSRSFSNSVRYCAASDACSAVGPLTIVRVVTVRSGMTNGSSAPGSCAT